MVGKWVNAAANIAFSLGENVFIVASASTREVKMVKIRVTGESTFDWIEAKYHKDRANYPAKCKEQATFSEDCFDGTFVEEINYNVDLVAIPQENGKRKREISKYCYLNKPMIVDVNFLVLVFKFSNNVLHFQKNVKHALTRRGGLQEQIAKLVGSQIIKDAQQQVGLVISIPKR